MREFHLPEDDVLVGLAFDEFPEPLLIVDPGFHVAAANRAARQARLGLAGVGPLCQAPAGDCAVGCDPSLAPCILRRVVLERSLQRDRCGHKGENNEERISELTAVPLCATGGGAFLGVVAMIRDVTESVRQEHLVGHALNEWQSTADAVPDLILLVAADRRVLRCNRAARALTGLHYDEILGRDVADVLSGTCDRQALEGQYGEVRWQRPRMLLELSKYPVSLLENHSSEVWVLRDVTALKRLKSVAVSLDAMNNMGHILTGLRHELAEPTDALEAGLTELLDSVETLSPADRGSRLRRCVDEAARIRALRERLRAFDGFDTVSPTTVEILPAFRSIAAEIRSQVEGQGIRLECEIPDDGGVCVSADVGALQRVIVGLVANAIAALAQRDRPCLRLLAQVDEEQVTLTVEDNGVGIPREDQELIFAPRFTTTPAGGGLGLAIARNILTRMNGAIELRSEIGQGTIVEVALPRLKGASAALDFSGALLAHLSWKRRLTEFVEGTGDMASSVFVEKDDLCPLGAWIYGEGAAHASHPAYAELRSAHAGFHQAAARVVRAVEWNRRSQARELLAAGGAYATQSVGVIAAILRMGARVVDWDRQLDLGFETLDAHHKELSILLRALEETSRAKAAPDEMAAVLMHLMASATDRFEAEQDLMRATRYDRSRLEEHVEAHNYFLDQVLRLQKACSFGKARLLPRTVELLRPWLVDHRRILDGALAKHLESTRYSRQEYGKASEPGSRASFSGR